MRKNTQLLNGWMGWVRAWPVVNWAGLVCKCVSRASVGMPVFWQRMVSNQRAQNGCLTNLEFSCVLFGSVVWCNKDTGNVYTCNSTLIIIGLIQSSAADPLLKWKHIDCITVLNAYCQNNNWLIVMCLISALMLSHHY